MRIEFSLPSFEDTTLHGYYTKPNNSPKKILVLVHGMAETIRRYDSFVDFMTDYDISVFTYDQRGHGKTAGSIDGLGRLEPGDWIKMRDDLKHVIELAKSTYPDIPVILMGHSMGSFVTRDYIQTYPNTLDRIILSGTGYQPKSLINAGIVLSEILMTIKSRANRSQLMNTITFGAFNKKFEDVRTDFDWLTRDRERVQDFIDDPYCGAIHTLGFFNEMGRNLKRILYPELPLDKVQGIPMLVYSGSMDPVGSFGKAVKKSADLYASTGYDVTFKLYDGGRHEMHNEINKDEVFQDVLDYIRD